MAEFSGGSNVLLKVAILVTKFFSQCHYYSSDLVKSWSMFLQKILKKDALELATTYFGRT